METDVQKPLRVLEYPPSVKRLAWAQLGVAIFFAGALLFFSFAALFGSNPEARGAFARVLPAGMILLGFQLFVFFRFTLPNAIAQVHLFADRIEVHRGKRVVIGRFADIVKLYGRVVPAFGGSFGFATKSGEVHAFTAKLDGAEYLIDALIEALPSGRAGLKELRADLLAFQKASASIRAHFRGFRGFSAVAHLFVVPVAFSAYLVARQGRMMTIPHPAIFFLQTTFAIGLAVLIVAIFFGLTLHVLESEGEPIPLRDALPVYFFALAVILGVFNRFDLNTLSRTETTAEVPHLGLPSGETLWIDGRANCLGCPHALHSGDRVVFLREGSAVLGKVIGLPGELAAVTRIVAGRAPASESLLIPSGKLAVRSNPSGDLVQVVELGDVLGRVEDSLDAFLRAHD